MVEEPEPYVWVTGQVEGERDVVLPKAQKTIRVGPTYAWMPLASVADAITEGRLKVLDDDEATQG